MDFFEVVQRRRSVRKFSDVRVEPLKLERILEAANRAPSAGNLQAYEIVVVRDAERRRALVTASGDQWFVGQAPVVLVFCAHPSRSASRYGERGEGLYAVQDATIACTYAMLAATALGLGTVWVGAFQEARVRAPLNLPESWLPVAILAVGYPAERPAPSPRRDLGELVHEARRGPSTS
jgi:nitroreductase